MKDTRSFFEKLTGAVKMEDTEMEYDAPIQAPLSRRPLSATVPTSPASIQKAYQKAQSASWDEEPEKEEEEEEGQLTVDVYESGNDVVIKCMVAGVRPEDLEITITRDTVTVKGKRETERNISPESYVHQELYWGSFSRMVTLPTEVDVEEAEAVEKHGLLIIRLPKIDRHKQAKLKVKG